MKLFNLSKKNKKNKQKEPVKILTEEERIAELNAEWEDIMDEFYSYEWQRLAWEKYISSSVCLQEQGIELSRIEDLELRNRIYIEMGVKDHECHNKCLPYSGFLNLR